MRNRRFVHSNATNPPAADSAMTHEQLDRLYHLRPFPPFEMLLADQRLIRVANLDFWSLSADHRTVTVYELPDRAEAIDIALIVSLKFHEPELTADVSSTNA